MPGSVTISRARHSHRGRSNWTTSNAFPTLGLAWSISSSVIRLLLLLGLDCAASAEGRSTTALNRSSTRASLDIRPPRPTVPTVTMSTCGKIALLRPRWLEARSESAVDLTCAVPGAPFRDSGNHQIPGARQIQVEVQSTPEDGLCRRDGQLVALEPRPPESSRCSRVPASSASASELSHPL